MQINDSVAATAPSEYGLRERNSYSIIRNLEGFLKRSAKVM